MTEYSEIIIAVLSLLGTAAGSLGGVMRANKLVSYRIEQLEKKQDRHNGLIERMVAVEQSCKSAHKRIDEILGE